MKNRPFIYAIRTGNPKKDTKGLRVVTFYQVIGAIPKRFIRWIDGVKYYDGNILNDNPDNIIIHDEFGYKKAILDAGGTP
jgi:hypothetical protein